MNMVEARSLLEEFLDDLKSRSREELLGLISNPACLEKTGPSGKIYQLEHQAVWDKDPGGDLRIIASIDDGGFLSAMMPLTSGFVLIQQPPGKS
jgi:hypothetical protein